MRRRSYLNAVLSVIAVCLVLLTIDRMSDRGMPAAFAQPVVSSQPEGGGLVAAADQRKAMIAELRGLSVRMERIEGLLARGISVKVSEMPELKLPRDARKD